MVGSLRRRKVGIDGIDKKAWQRPGWILSIMPDQIGSSTGFAENQTFGLPRKEAQHAHNL
jgi:hypothetical protein